MLLLALAAAAAAMTEVDQFDLRCVWVSELAAKQAEPSDRELFAKMASWFEGRVAGRSPEAVGRSYILQNFSFPGAKATDADLKACADIYASWQTQEIRGSYHDLDRSSRMDVGKHVGKTQQRIHIPH